MRTIQLNVVYYKTNNMAFCFIRPSSKRERESESIELYGESTTHKTIKREEIAVSWNSTTENETATASKTFSNPTNKKTHKRLTPIHAKYEAREKKKHPFNLIPAKKRNLHGSQHSYQPPHARSNLYISK